MTPPTVQLLAPPTMRQRGEGAATVVQAEGRTSVRRAVIRTDVSYAEGGSVSVRTLTGNAGGATVAPTEAAKSAGGEAAGGRPLGNPSPAN